MELKTPGLHCAYLARVNISVCPAQFHNGLSVTSPFFCRSSYIEATTACEASTHRRSLLFRGLNLSNYLQIHQSIYEGVDDNYSSTHGTASCCLICAQNYAVSVRLFNAKATRKSGAAQCGPHGLIDIVLNWPPTTQPQDSIFHL